MQLRAAHQHHQEAAIAEAMRQFERCDVLQIAERVAADQRRYHEYVSASLGLEQQMRDARTELRDRIPKIEQQVDVLGRSGIAETVACGQDMGLNSLAAAVSAQYRTLPETVRRGAESAIRRERRDRDRSRESIAM